MTQTQDLISIFVIEKKKGKKDLDHFEGTLLTK